MPSCRSQRLQLRRSRRRGAWAGGRKILIPGPESWVDQKRSAKHHGVGARYYLKHLDSGMDRALNLLELVQLFRSPSFRPQTHSSASTSSSSISSGSTNPLLRFSLTNVAPPRSMPGPPMRRFCDTSRACKSRASCSCVFFGCRPQPRGVLVESCAGNVSLS